MGPWVAWMPYKIGTWVSQRQFPAFCASMARGPWVWLAGGQDGDNFHLPASWAVMADALPSVHFPSPSLSSSLLGSPELCRAQVTKSSQPSV